MARHVLLACLLFASPLVATAQHTIDAPDSAPAGSEIAITVGGSVSPREFITIVERGSREGSYNDYKYVSKTGPIALSTPTTPGDYEIRVLGPESPYPTLARHALRVQQVSATLEAPAQVAAGASFQVRWTGPGNARDYVGIGDATHPYLAYVYTRQGNPLSLRAPDQPGEYELRYFLGAGDKVAGSRKLTVGAVSASLSAPATVVGGSEFAVRWTGPGNKHDYITIVPKGAREGEYGPYQYTARGNPVTLRAPLAAGEYELRYSTGQSSATVARVALQVTPAAHVPGRISVETAGVTDAPGAVEVILDASGSMRQKLGTQRRIDVAKQTLTDLVRTLPAGTPFALRVFGREVGSCQTALDIPLGALDREVARARIASLDAKNEAKTPIGASLEQVTQDLASARGNAEVIVVTDGEETCGGDPAAAIASLRERAPHIRVSIVGLAIEDAALAATFRRWADAGGGLYFDARDAGALNRALALAVRPRFEVIDASGHVLAEGVVGGEPVSVMPGTHIVRLKNNAGREQPVTVREKDTVAVKL
ncbi:MAG: VWA domain-containing protein [Steroidobacteraceae bacterium]|nr:VWA domain-containing protein [Steroidobacteraceae bacterium]